MRLRGQHVRDLAEEERLRRGVQRPPGNVTAFHKRIDGRGVEVPLAGESHPVYKQPGPKYQKSDEPRVPGLERVSPAFNTDIDMRNARTPTVQTEG